MKNSRENRERDAKETVGWGPGRTVTKCNESTVTHGTTLIRWALRLSTYRYTIELVPGDNNVWADMFTRWAAPRPQLRAKALMLAPLAPSLGADFEWPNAGEIRLVQDGASSVLAHSPEPQEPVTTPASDGLRRVSTGQIWIPSMASDLQLRICIVAHTGLGGHRGYVTTSNAIKYEFTWLSLELDVKPFFQTCLHCLSTIGGDRTPRPLGEALHATRPNEVIHFDFPLYGPVRRWSNICSPDQRRSIGVRVVNSQPGG
jgi:Integrase zinc binding domain